MKPAVALCDRELAEEVDKLMSATSTSCNQPHYELPSIENCGDGECTSTENCGGMCTTSEKCVDGKCTPIENCDGKCKSSEKCVDGKCKSSATTYLPSMMTLMFAWVMMLLTKPLLT